MSRILPLRRWTNRPSAATNTPARKSGTRSSTFAATRSFASTTPSGTTPTGPGRITPTGRGGFIWERNSPNTYLGEFDLGLEWQITPQMELTCEYDWVNRTNTSGKAPILANGQYAQFQGDLLRFQFQVNY